VWESLCRDRCEWSPSRLGDGVGEQVEMADVAGRFLEHVHHDPTIHLMCGLVAAGKTTLARKLAEELQLPAVRLSRDEWMIRPYGLPHEDPAYVEQLAPAPNSSGTLN
jgi:hypothetical protein